MGKFSNHSTYYDNNNNEVPSVTTILKILNKPYLNKWANAMGFKRIKIDDILEEKSEIGTMVHMLIEKFIKKEKPEYVETKHTNLMLMKLYMDQFITWYKSHNVEHIELEYHTTCDKFGGTVDFYGKIDDKYTVLDFKTSKAVYGSMFLQLSAYVYMLELEGKQVDQVAILCVGTEKTIYRVMEREKLDDYIRTYLLLADVFTMWYNISEDDKWGKII